MTSEHNSEKPTQPKNAKPTPEAEAPATPAAGTPSPDAAATPATAEAPAPAGTAGTTEPAAAPAADSAADGAGVEAGGDDAASESGAAKKAAKPNLAKGPLGKAIGVLVALAVVAGGAGYAGYHAGSQKAGAAAMAELVGPAGSLNSLTDVHRRIENDPFAMGDLAAPVVISYFSDFECPYCTKFFMESEPHIIEDYVNKGLVRIEWNDFAINGENAVRAASAGRAAAAQGRFFEFANALYTEAAHRGNGHPNFSVDDLLAIGAKAGIKDMQRFKDDVINGRYERPVVVANTYASALGMTGTPTFVIGETPVSGALPWEQIKKIIDQELDNAKEDGTPYSEGEKGAAPANTQGADSGEKGEASEASEASDAASSPSEAATQQK